jgi:signal transduction histidine kinase/DNA-binding response OmpR family regulator
MLQGQKDLLTVGRLILSELAPVVTAQHAAFYILDAGKEHAELSLLASYAHKGQDAVGEHLALGEGVVGQCALEKQKILLTNVPPDYIRISSGLGSAPPQNILVLPVVFEGLVKGVLELASFERFNPTHQAFLDQLTESIGIVLNTIEANMRTEDLLKQSQSLAGELQNRQEQLQTTNAELEEKAHLLAHQNAEVERKNQEVEQARQALEDKAKQLALTSKYKSEFLANMSHELRTPLNSLLILSEQLSRNPEGNLTAKQTEFAKTIHSSGNDLLMLINDILDLSKIESGTVVLDMGELRFTDMHSYVERTFRHVAESKGLDFAIELDADLPRSIYSDSKRLQQVIKNLLSNAFKFTHHGKVSLSVAPAAAGWNPENDNLNHADGVIAFSVADTGIGISADKQHIIFEAFQQADGSTSRKYGGTGLGLAISRELSRLLGGEIRLTSSPGRGSIFTLYLPQAFLPPKPPRKPTQEIAAQPKTNGNLMTKTEEERPPAMPETPRLFNEVGDDRDTIQPDDPVLLIVENDLNFARLLLEVAREKGFKGLVTSLGAVALAMTREYMPAALTLDILLPDMDGWRVLERLKRDIDTRHIPVYVVSTEEARERALASGARGMLVKPVPTRDALEKFLLSVKDYVERPVKELLVIESDAERRQQLLELIGNGGDIQTTAVESGKDALELLRRQRIDCMVLGPRLPDLSLHAFVDEALREDRLHDVPVILYTPQGVDNGDDSGVAELAHAVNLKQVSSPERLLDQTALALHCPMAKLPEMRQQVLEHLRVADKALAGKKVLIVDDDIRNIFALTSLLEWHNMKIYSAETGRRAIKILQNERDMDIVLMDIMMPEMDGMDTMREIRKMPEFKDLPIVAVTAKAMKGDREKCIEAGAWDYLSKPVDTQQLISVLRAWLCR